MATSEPKRLVVYSQPAIEDLADIYSHTVGHWGSTQAEKYAEFLLNAAQRIADGDLLSDLVRGHKHKARLTYVKWPRARYGHYIIFREIEGGIYVARILHGAMDPRRHLKA